MKKAIIYLSLLLSVHTAIAATDSTGNLIDQVKLLREAIYQRDKAATKTFFDFPFTDADFWQQAGLRNLSDKKSPITAALFDLYFDKIFTKDFIHAFLKIKTKELYEKGVYKTEEFTDDPEEYYSMEADYDKEKQTIILDFRGHDPKIEDGGEDNITFMFKMVDNQLKYDPI